MEANTAGANQEAVLIQTFHPVPQSEELSPSVEDQTDQRLTETKIVAGQSDESSLCTNVL